MPTLSDLPDDQEWVEISVRDEGIGIAAEHLVVDDDVQLLKIVTHNLQSEGYQVLAIRDGAQALEAIERDTPDLVLLDVMLPGMDGSGS